MDLNGDGRAEVLVWVPTREWGGTGGYPLLIFSRYGTGYRFIWSYDQAWSPVVVLNTKRHGWRDLAVTIGGGGDPMRLVVFRFDKGGYTNEFEALGSRRPQGRWLFTGTRTDTTFGAHPGGAPN